MMSAMRTILILFLIMVAYVMFAENIILSSYLPSFIDSTYIIILFFVGIILVVVNELRESI